jgi:DNA-directed RNA polymerase subunit RPC12/RpoP
MPCCAHCDEEVTIAQIFRSAGVCPHCGYLSKGRGLEIKTKVCRYKSQPWWKFFSSPELEFKS